MWKVDREHDTQLAQPLLEVFEFVVVGVLPLDLARNVHHVKSGFSYLFNRKRWISHGCSTTPLLL